MEFSHKPVLFSETIENLAVRPEGIYIDGTAGGGGHSRAIAEKLTTGRLLSIDQDPDAVAVLRERLKDLPVSVWQGNFSAMKDAAAENGIFSADGVLFDLGVSSYQFDNPERGFSYQHDAPLDMRMSREGTSAADLVNTLSRQELERVISRYGEDRNARSIAMGIVRAREKEPIRTTLRLAEIVKSSVPAKVRREAGHPARKTFQALRIAVNGELDRLSEGLDAAFDLLKPGGRLCVISFQSLEDRMVKQRMASWCQGCICPPDFPVCVCGRKPKAKLLHRGGIAPTEQEIDENPRCRSARLRVCEKI